MKHRRKFMLTMWHVFAITTLVSTFVFVGLIAYWTLAPLGKSAIEFPSGLKFEKSEVRAGEDATIDAGYCKNIKTTGTVLTRSFQDDITYYIPAQLSNVPVGCHLNYKTIIHIPDNLPTDTYTYNLDFTYQINPLISQRYTFKSSPIKVIKE